MRSYAKVLVCLGFVGTRASADEPASATVEGIHDITEMSLDDLLGADVDVASKIPQTYRETPGVITVITREEIMDSGARDIEDVLALVPGFSLGLDVEGVTDLGVRGNWGHEGKVLMLIDGQQMNENLYSSNQLGNHYPVDQIQRIEIIRGPGSAIYGGYAELAVINIITRGADDLKGGSVYLSSGRMKDAFGYNNLSVAVGDSAGPVKFSLSGFLGKGHRSDATFTDFYGDTYSLKDHSADPAYVNLGAQMGRLSARFIYDHFGANERDALAQNETHAVEQKFIGLYGELKYDAKINDKLVVTPKINYTRQLPWRVLDPGSPVLYDKTAERITGGASASYTIKKGLNVLGGAEVYLDHAFLNQPATAGGTQTQFGTEDSVSYQNEAVYVQGLWNNPTVNVTVGARYEHHSQFGNSFVPRIALTKIVEPFHFKLLYSNAFRAPGFEDINLAPAGLPVEPERTNDAEAEVGYAIGTHQFVTLNAFYVRINKAIVYFVDPVTLVEGYQNFSRTGTIGAELDYKFRYAWGYFDANYSFYSAHGDNQVPLYAVAGQPNALLGMPTHKVTLHGGFKLWKNLRLGPSVIVTAGQYAKVLPGDGMGVGTDGSLGTTVLANLFLNYTDLGVKGLEAGIGVYNLFDDKFQYAQPYDGGHAPMRGATREGILRLGYNRPF